MKKFLIFCVVAISVHTAQAQPVVDQPPKPVPPISSSRPGMKWAVVVQPAPGAPAEKTLTGFAGQHLTKNTLVSDNAKPSTWVAMGERLFYLDSDVVVERPAQDSSPIAANLFEVTGFPGIHWANASTLKEVVKDKTSDRWLAVHRQEAAELEKFGSGENATWVPTGPSIEVTAYFDALTGLPLRAEVGDKLYTYQVSLTGGTDPQLTPAQRQKMEQRLRLNAAYQEMLRKEAAQR